MQQAVHRSSSLSGRRSQVAGEAPELAAGIQPAAYDLRPTTWPTACDLVHAGPPLAHFAPGGRTECPACIDEGGCREASLFSIGGCSLGGTGRSDLRSADAVENGGESEPRFPRGRPRARARRRRESGSGESSRRPWVHSRPSEFAFGPALAAGSSPARTESRLAPGCRAHSAGVDL